MTGIKQAVILAGGRGKRLRPITDKIPKPMVQINGRPFLEYLVELLNENGISEIVMLLGYLPDKVIEHLGDGSKFGIKIKYSVGAVEDETGTRIRNAKHLLDNKFLLLYCDNYWPLKLGSILDFYRRFGKLAMLTAYNNRDGGGEYGYKNNLTILENGEVTFYGQPAKSVELNAIDIGFFVLDKKILNFMPAHNFSFQHEGLPRLIAERQLAAYRTDHPYYPITGEKLLNAAAHFLEPKKVIFLDRDGVINKKMPEENYVKHWEEFEFLPGALEALSLLKKAGYQTYIITNQRGVGRGLMKESDLETLHSKLAKELKENNIEFGGIYYCPHDFVADCFCRKPKPGMFFRAAREHHLDLTKAWFVGDDQRDLEAGKAAGCKTILLDQNRNLLRIVQEEILI